MGFEKVLIANRGEIACRIIRACREMGLSTVAVYASNDTDSLFVVMADSAVHLPGEGLAQTYLNGQAIIDVAISSGAGAIHPGFGFLSERADFASAVIDSGLTWVGPSPEAIESMGDKMTARVMMRAAGVPVIPGEELDEITGDATAIVEAAASRVNGRNHCSSFSNKVPSQHGLQICCNYFRRELYLPSLLLWLPARPFSAGCVGVRR